MKIKNLLGRLTQAATVSNEGVREQGLERRPRSIPRGHRNFDAGAGTQSYRKFCGHL